MQDCGAEEGLDAGGGAGDGVARSADGERLVEQRVDVDAAVCGGEGDRDGPVACGDGDRALAIVGQASLQGGLGARPVEPGEVDAAVVGHR